MGTTHLGLNYCFDTGHAHIMEGVETAYKLMKNRIRSTHLHDNDGENDVHRFPYLADDNTLDWPNAMASLRSRPEQDPLMLEVREVDGMEAPITRAKEVLERLEKE